MPAKRKDGILWSSITPRQMQVLKLYAQGYNTIEIAAEMSVEKFTVGSTREAMLNNTGCVTIAQACYELGKREASVNVTVDKVI